VSKEIENGDEHESCAGDEDAAGGAKNLRSDDDGEGFGDDGEGGGAKN